MGVNDRGQQWQASPFWLCYGNASAEPYGWGNLRVLCRINTTFNTCAECHIQRLCCAERYLLRASFGIDVFHQCVRGSAQHMLQREGW